MRVIDRKTYAIGSDLSKAFLWVWRGWLRKDTPYSLVCARRKHVPVSSWSSLNSRCLSFDDTGFIHVLFDSDRPLGKEPVRTRNPNHASSSYRDSRGTPYSNIERQIPPFLTSIDFQNCVLLIVQLDTLNLSV